jgi:hypothetical protein
VLFEGVETARASVVYRYRYAVVIVGYEGYVGLVLVFYRVVRKVVLQGTCGPERAFARIVHRGRICALSRFFVLDVFDHVNFLVRFTFYTHYTHCTHCTLIHTLHTLHT